MQVVSGWELWQWYEQARDAAIAASIPVSEVDWLLQEVSDLDRLALRLGSFKDKPQIRLTLPFSELADLWQQRTQTRKPVQYLVGATSWRHFRLKVSPAVLIPRPETESLIDLAVTAVQNSQTAELTSGDWVDLGTGSGAIALGLAEVFPEAKIHAVDRSVEALAIAQENAQGLGFAERVRFYQGSWWEPLTALKGKLGGMVSNPPYIPSFIIPELQPEVAWHEPHLALDGGEKGLDCIRYLVDTAPDYLRPGGIWLVEMMAGQASAVVDMLRQQGSYCNMEIYPDLAGIDRFALAYRI